MMSPAEGYERFVQRQRFSIDRAMEADTRILCGANSDMDSEFEQMIEEGLSVLQSNLLHLHT